MSQGFRLRSPTALAWQSAVAPPSRRARPAGGADTRRAARRTRVVLRRYMDVPSKNASLAGAPAARSGVGVRPGVFLWVTFLCTSKEKWLAHRRCTKALLPSV